MKTLSIARTHPSKPHNSSDASSKESSANEELPVPKTPNPGFGHAVVMGQKEKPNGDRKLWSIFPFTNRLFGVPVSLTHSPVSFSSSSYHQRRRPDSAESLFDPGTSMPAAPHFRARNCCGAKLVADDLDARNLRPTVFFERTAKIKGNMFRKKATRVHRLLNPKPWSCLGPCMQLQLSQYLLCWIEHSKSGICVICFGLLEAPHLANSAMSWRYGKRGSRAHTSFNKRLLQLPIMIGRYRPERWLTRRYRWSPT